MMVFQRNYIRLEIWDIFLNLILIFYIGNWGNWNLIAKNIFQFIELSIVNIILSLSKKSINFDFISIKISNKYIKKYPIGKFDLQISILLYMNIRYWIFIYIFNNFKSHFLIWIDYFVEKHIYLYVYFKKILLYLFKYMYIYIFIVFIKLAVIFLIFYFVI